MAVRFTDPDDAYNTTAGHAAGDKTYMVWFNPRAFNNNACVFRTVNAGATSGVRLESNTTGAFYIDFTGIADSSSFQTSLNTWYRAAIVFSGGNVLFYMGAAGAALTLVQTVAYASYTADFLCIGNGNQGNAVDYFNGAEANFKEFAAALSADELEVEFHFYQPQRMPVRWYPFLNAELTDYSGNGYTLTAGASATTIEDGPPIQWRRPRASQVTSSGPGTSNVAVAGIASAQAFGSTTITPGSVSIAVGAGIASGEAFGAPTVAPGQVAIQPPGIASNESFGAPEIAANKVLVPSVPTGAEFGIPTVIPGTAEIEPTGIPSGEAFGTPGVAFRILVPAMLTPGGVGEPTVIPGEVEIVASGIGSAEQFGSATVSFRVEVFWPIESAEDFGIPTLTQFIEPPSIPSEEAFGSTSGELPPIRMRRTPLRTITRYELACVAVIPNRIGPPARIEIDPIAWTELSYKEELSRPEEMTATCKKESLSDPVFERLENFSETWTELRVLRNGVPAFSGPMLSWSTQGEDVTFSAAGPLSYLETMWITQDLVFADQDRFAIVAGLINHWQNQTFGHFGIDTSQVGTSGSLTSITYLAKDGNKVGDRVPELGQGTGGFDIEIGPDLVLRMYSPRMGVDRSAGEDAIIFDNRNVTSSDTTMSGTFSDLASVAYGTGKTPDGQVLWSPRENEELMSKIGRRGVMSSFDSADQAVLDGQTQGLLDSRGRVLIQPGPNARVTGDADLLQYRVGDTISYQERGRLAASGAFRLRSREVKAVAETGAESVTFQFT